MVTREHDTSSPSSTPVDTTWGTFTDEGPWNVVLDDLVWKPGVPQLRADAERRLPAMINPSRRFPGRRVFTVGYHAARAVIPWALTKRRRGGAESRADISARLRLTAEKLGPTYIKLGQIISSGEGIFPAELVAEFAKCRDQVPAERFSAVREVVESDLGSPLESVFSTFSIVPIAAASIAQVHKATLLDGTRVEIGRAHV